MKPVLPWLALIGLFTAHEARADLKAASACAAGLQPYARLVFDAVTARPQPDVALRSVIEARTRELVFTDRLMMGAARPAAEAASLCLRISRNCTGDAC